MIVISQDPDDHWFCLIGQNDKVHLVEYSPNGYHIAETFTLGGILTELGDILLGAKPERFYGITGPHKFEIWVHSRGLLNKETVREYLESPL